MRKILSALLCFSLFSALPLAGEDGEGGAGVSAGVELVAVPPGPAAGGAQGLSDLDIFRLNTVDSPLDSAEALLRLLTGKNREELAAFREDHCAKIAEMMRSLHRAHLDQRISREEYTQISIDLRPFDLRSIFLRDRRAGPPDGPGDRYRPNEVDALVDVHVAAEAGDNAAAQAALNAAIAAYPQNASVQTAAASYYNETRNFPQAEKSATAALSLDDLDPDAYKARALARASLDDRKGAIEDIKRAMSIDPQDESARVLSALLESRKGVPTLKSISSVDEIRRALGARDDSPAAVRGSASAMGELHGARGDEPAGAPDFAKSRAYLKTAVAKNRLGDYESAARYATLAIEKDPGNYEAYLERANANNFLGRYDDAVRDAGYVIERDPANMQAFNMRAWTLNRKGRAGEAVTDASRAIGINPAYADAWFNRALAYESQGDYGRMLEDFKQAASLSGAYSSRYQDAVAQYGPRVPGFAGSPDARRASAPAGGGAAPAGNRGPLNRFLMLMLFTLVGGGLVAAGLVHIMTSRPQAGTGSVRKTHPDVLSPSVFYEGVATGKYKIERKLGEGAMGVVYEATDQSLGRKVAIKRMGEEIKVNEREKQRFLEEARTVALLHHPGIVEIYTIFEEEDNIYLVFEHVDGVTLDKVLDKEARIPFERARKMFGEAAAALAYAHDKNIVHRDLKLANMMLSGENAVKVMDFGLAHRARESMARMSNAEVVGSPAYMAPEQELGVSSAESDIYSLGVCLYEALSGVLPFQGPDFHQQKTRRSYQRLSEMLPNLPKGVDEVVARCLDPEPEKRFRSAEELARALGALG
jgi:tetratricopeptide (TPR) repeat protein/tRNA A-37 threonylcarbamoyl transferase component Bud32